MTLKIDEALERIVPLCQLHFDPSVTRTTILRCILDRIHLQPWEKTVHHLKPTIRPRATKQLLITHEEHILSILSNIENNPRSSLQELATHSLRIRNRLTRPYRVDIPTYESINY